MRLIDTDKAIKMLNSNTLDGMTMIAFLETQPVAYDVDKVVEELEEQKHMIALDGDDADFYKEAINDAIEIVKQGVVSDDVCEWIKYDYRTICPKNHDANNPYWRIPDNMDKLKFCPYCGKKIKIVGD